ncbi:MAG: hypothetical protein HKP48_03325 [Winogradskyella sp.]|uniref:hypothetical protein n=1 Tax=Winogradskyella sp. TaxID=1883156 RepID=UPI0017E19239|nr:hypothetical protein [Winogradskyella sp.]MBT8243903.1 hypothetical protein [Winogradskyella sp.]NNK22340.1 hypothetical protein [Winogradskyella sp.]
MKNKIILILITIFLFSCDKDESEAELLGSWRMVARLSDPGDGSGVFTAVASDQIITFNNDGTIISNGSLCDIFENTLESTSGTYSAEDMFFITEDCGLQDFEYQFEIDGQFLTYFVICIEACGVRYQKI